MAESPKKPRTRPASKATESTTKPETTAVESKPCCGDSRCPFASLRTGIDWMNVVDDFKIAGHANYFPRWAFVILVLLYLAV
jgi:hypothetical protein